jgi:NAD(P)-dependent dehydrogenase (short-subunit alcohol dehydrogenase family)
MAAFVRIFKNKWITPPQAVTESFGGRVIIVTGATSGLGEEAAYKFAALGASKVILTARDEKKGESTKAALEARLQGKDQLEVWKLDMMDYDSVTAFARRANELEHLDIVVLNAGMRRAVYTQSNYGWEEDLQVNTLSTTLLALLLLPKLKQSKQHTGKIPVLEFVNSGLHQSAVVPSEVQEGSDILAHYNKKEHFKAGNQYKFSKVFLMYAARALANKISSGDVIITSVCPGMVYTNLGREYFFPGVYYVAYVFILLFLRTPAQGANTVLSGTTQGESIHGRFWQHDKIQPIPLSQKGESMKQLGSRMFDEIIKALGNDVPNVSSAVDDAVGSVAAK